MTPIIYIAFLICFVIWMAGKAILYRKAKDEHRQLVSLINSVKDKLDSIDSKLSRIDDKIDILSNDKQESVK